MDNSTIYKSSRKFNLDDIDDALAELNLKEIEESKKYTSFKLSPITLNITYKPFKPVDIANKITNPEYIKMAESDRPFDSLKSHFKELVSLNKEIDTKKLEQILESLKEKFKAFLSLEKEKQENPLDLFFNNNSFFNDKKKSSKFSIDDLTKLKKLSILEGKEIDINNVLNYKLSQIPKEIYNIYKPLHLYISESLSSITLLTTKIKKSFTRVSSIFSDDLDQETKIIILKILLNIFVNISTSKIKLHSEYSYAFGYFLVLLLDMFDKIIEVLTKKKEKKQEYYKLIFATYICGYELDKIECKEIKEYFFDNIRYFINDNNPEMVNDILCNMGYVIRKKYENELNGILDELKDKHTIWKADKEKEFYSKKLEMNIVLYNQNRWPKNEYKSSIKDKERLSIKFQTVYDGDYT